MKKYKYCLIAFLLLTININAQFETLNTKLEHIKKKYDLVGMSVAIVKDNNIVYNNGFGYRDVARSKVIKSNTKFRIASISKMITATAMMILYDRGEISLDDDVSKYLGYDLKNPKFKDEVITIASVLSHTAGLRDGNTYSTFLSSSYSSNIPNLKELIVEGGEFYSSSMWASQSPNEKYFQYSNINYGLIGTLIEKISGKRFDVFCKEEIFDRLEIDASFNVQDIVDIDNIAVLYRKSGSRWVPQMDNYNGTKPTPRDLSNYQIGTNGLIFGPQGSLRASSEDLAKLVQMYLNKGSLDGITIISNSAFDAMRKVFWDNSVDSGNNYYGIFNTYALGNHTTKDLLKGETLIGHPGEAYGLISDMYFSEGKKYGIIFMTNGGKWGSGTYSGWYNVEEEIFNACYDEIINSTVGINSKAEAEDNLRQNYPNPFNPKTTFEYTLSKESYVQFSIYDIVGNKVQTLVKENQTPGLYKIPWSAKNVSSGIYVYQLATDYFTSNKKMIYLK